MRSTLFLTLLLSSVSSFSQIVTIPDPAFKAYLLPLVDINHDNEVSVSEASQSTHLSPSHRGIENLQGIEAFINLEYLSINGNPLLTAPDLHTLTSLEQLNCNDTALTEQPIFAASMPNLQILELDGNHFTQLDLSGLPNLTHLSVDGSDLETLDVADQLDLQEIVLSQNQLTAIPDLSNQTNLTLLNLSHNLIEELVVEPALTALVELNLADNQIATLPDLTAFTALKKLNLSTNLLTEITLHPGLNTLNVSHNGLTDLPFLHAGLTTLDCSYNQLTEIGPNNASRLYASHNQLTSLSVPFTLAELDVSYNQLTELTDLGDRFNFISLLDCSHNLLTQLPEYPSEIDTLICAYNQLTSLPDGVVRVLDCSHNQISILPDMPRETLDCSWNQITALPHGSSVRDIDCSHNAISGSLLDFDLGHSVRTLNISHNNLTSITLFSNGAINCSYNQLTMLYAEEVSSLDCSHNQLTHIDYSSTPSVLNCSYNQLTSLFSWFFNELDCSNNLFTTLGPISSIDSADPKGSALLSKLTCDRNYLDEASCDKLLGRGLGNYVQYGSLNHALPNWPIEDVLSIVALVNSGDDVLYTLDCGQENP